MRTIQLHQDWFFGPGLLGTAERVHKKFGDRVVQLPHDYMIETDVYPSAPSAQASGYYNAAVAHYVKEVEIPADWEGDFVSLRFDGAMMNATVEVNGNFAALQHYGYAPFETDITSLVYPGQTNRIVVTLNPSMQPNSRWYSGAGLFRGVDLVHTPKLRVAFGGLFAFTRKIDYAPDGAPETAYLRVSAEVENHFAENRVAEVVFELIRDDDGETVLRSKTLVQVPALSSGVAYSTLTVDQPLLWSADAPRLYRLRAVVREKGAYKTRIIPAEHPVTDAEEVLFGIRTVEADVRHGLRVNGKSVKLKGGCLHHDNGVIGAVTLPDAEFRKVRKLKEIGFNAIRTTHNPPSAALIEACDRLGMYVFDEAFDVWRMGKQPGDYNQFFATDWEKDLAAFVRRDRCHPSVLLWSTGNEIGERAGLADGYVWQNRLAEAFRRHDPSRPISNGICSFWCGLDDVLQAEQQRRWEESGKNAAAQNANPGEEDLLWETYTEGYANALDIVGYNYLENKYDRDHALFPERVILGSENYPVEIGIHWPVIEKTPWIIGDFTWTAWDYIGEAGIGKASFYEPGDPRIGNPWGDPSPYPWRTANDADIDITGRIRPQGVYRRIVWGSPETAVFSYDPANTARVETLSGWGFPGVWRNWNWAGQEGAPVRLLVFSAAEEVELRMNGESVGRLKAGESTVHNMPLCFCFSAVYQPGTVEAVSYTGGREVSRDTLTTVGQPAAIRLWAETDALHAGGQSLAYVHAELVDAEGRLVPHVPLLLQAEVAGAATLQGFGSANPKTEENYTAGRFTTWQGAALAVLRSGREAGEARLRVSAEGLPAAELILPVLP